jgi:hypothetical protein
MPSDLHATTHPLLAHRPPAFSPCRLPYSDAVKNKLRAKGLERSQSSRRRRVFGKLGGVKGAEETVQEVATGIKLKAGFAPVPIAAAASKHVQASRHVAVDEVVVENAAAVVAAAPAALASRWVRYTDASSGDVWFVREGATDEAVWDVPPGGIVVSEHEVK